MPLLHTQALLNQIESLPIPITHHALSHEMSPPSLLSKLSV